MLTPMQKAASSMSETVGLGAGSGAAVGVLTALLDGQPSLRRVLRNALVGAGGGAAVGAGAHALSSPAPDKLPDKVSVDPRQMNLGIAALSGMLPGVGPAIHGGISQGWEQGLASGAGSVGGSLAVALPALIKAKGVAENLPASTRPLAALASILGATGAAYAGNRMRENQEKSAAEMVRKTRMVEEHHDHCPHCDHEFTEKGYPRPILPDDPEERDKVFRSGDYDEQCPACKGIIDQKEMTDEEIDGSLGYFFQGDPAGAEKLRQQLRDRREKQRQRKSEREKRAAAKPPTVKEIAEAMTAAGLPRDVQFFVNGNRATACFGDWHEKSVLEAGNKVGRKLFSQWEEPSDSEIGKPDWVKKVVSSDTKPADMIHDCVENTCPQCGKRHRPNCKDQTGDETHEPKKKTKKVCGSCANGAPLSNSRCPGCGRPFPKGEPYPDVRNCEACERYGPPKEKSASLRAAVLGGVVKSAAEAPGIRQARNATHTDPTPAQAAAGNYAKGEFDFKGITLKIENPKGTERRGYDKNGAVTWRRTMHADYGYVKSTKAIDGDAIDFFMGPDHDSDLIVAIDQYRGDTFDETKFVFGVKTQEEGEKLYLRHYPRGWRLGPSSTTTVPQFKAWLKDGDHKKPFKGQMVKAAVVADWLRGDDEGADWRWALLGSHLATVPVGIGAKLYADKVIPAVAGAPRNLAERDMVRKLTAMAEESGDLRVVKAKDSALQAQMDAQPTLGNMLRHLLGKEEKPAQIGSAYSPMTEEIVLAKGQKGPAILAHELGHARGGGALFLANVLGKAGLGTLPVLSLMSQDEDKGHKLALAGTAVGGGMLASELDASRRGYRMIRDLGGSRKAALKSFIGIPTYLAAGSIPLLAHHMKKRMGGYDYTLREAIDDVTHGKPLGKSAAATTAPMIPTTTAPMIPTPAASKPAEPQWGAAFVKWLRGLGKPKDDIYRPEPGGLSASSGIAAARG